MFAAPVDYFWFHLRRMGIWLPLTTVVIWGISISWIVGLPALLDPVSKPKPWGWVFDVWPFVCLCAAAAVCSVRFSGTWLVGKDRKRAATLCMGTPIAEVVGARLWADGIALLGTVCLISIDHEWWLFHADNGFLLNLVKSGLAEGYTSPREVVSWAIGVPLLGSAAAWVCLGFAYRPIRRIAKLSFLGFVVLMVFAEKSHCPPPMWNVPLVLGVLVAPFTAWLCLGVVRKAISWKIAAKTYCVWLALIAAIYPLGSRMTDAAYGRLDAFSTSASLASLLLLPYCAAVLDLRRRRKKAGVSDCDTPSVEPLPLRRACIAGLVCGALLLVWIRWPAEPAVYSLWRAQGLPTTFRELNALYPHVDDDANLALKYLDVEKRCVERFRKWIDGLPPEPRTESGFFGRSTDEKSAAAHEPFNLAQLKDSVPYEARENLLILGYARLERDKAVPPEVQCWTRYFWDAVGGATAQELHAIANSGLIKSRYPIDFSAGMDVELPHIVQVRDLGRVLQVEAVLAALDGDAERAAEAIHEAFFTITSMRTEPLLVSQVAWREFYSTAVKTAETLMGHAAFSEDQLRMLQGDLGAAFPPIREDCLTESALRVDLMFSMDLANSPARLWAAYRSQQSMEYNDDPTPFDAPMTVGYSLFGLTQLDMLALLRDVSTLHEWVRVTRTTGKVDLDALEKAGWPFEYRYPGEIVPRDGNEGRHRKAEAPWRFKFSTALLPALERTYVDEIRRRTEFDAARIAIVAERFRLEKGTSPQTLDALVPDYVEGIPDDPWNPGHPLSSVVKPNGDFVVYSYGHNRKDDGGKEYEREKGIYSCDITFTIAAQKIVDAVE